MPISSSYAKILRETNFHTWEIPRSGSKAKDGEKRERKKDRMMAKLCMAHASTHGALKPPGTKLKVVYFWEAKTNCCLIWFGENKT